MDKQPLTIEQFMKNIDDEILAYIECGCGEKRFLTVPLCRKCGKSTEEIARWQIIDWAGEIKTYCIVYVGPPELKDISPYCSVIVSFGDGLQISAILDEEINFKNPPTNLIGQKVVHSFIERGDGKKILAMKFDA